MVKIKIGAMAYELDLPREARYTMFFMYLV
jgi:hypothetical protein